VISNWLWGGGGTAPAAMPDDIAVVLDDSVPVDDVPLDVPLLLNDEALAAAPVVEQSLLALAAWYRMPPASIPAGRPAPAQPLSSMPTPTGRPTSGVRRRLVQTFPCTISLPFLATKSSSHHTRATPTWRNGVQRRGRLE
jgi:hypothetical protein